MLRIRSVYIIVLMMFSFSGFSQADTIVRISTFGGGNNDNAEEIEATSDGGYIVVGSTSSNSSGNTDVYLLKVDSLCNYEWSFALGGTNNDWGYSVKETFDKGFIIAASSNSYGNGGYDAVLMKRDSLGNYVWQKSYGGDDWDFAYSVVQTYDSGYVFCGETYNNTNGYSDVYIVKTNSSGDTLWTQTIGGALIDKGNSVIETSDSNIVVAGLRNTIADSTQAYIIKLSSNGTLLWDSIYGGSESDVANAVIETINGDYVTTGASSSFLSIGDLDFYLTRIDSDGNLIWENAHGLSEEEIGYDLIEDANGNIISVGYTKSVGGGMKDAQLIYVTSGGWWGSLSPTYGDGQDELFKSITLGLDGDYCMAGSTDSYGNGLNDVLLIKLDTVYSGQVGTIFSNTGDSIPINIVEVFKETKFKLYPNPSEGYLNIHIDDYTTGDTFHLEIYNIYGELVRRLIVNSRDVLFNLTDLSTQFFTYKVLESDVVVMSGKLIIY